MLPFFGRLAFLLLEDILSNWRDPRWIGEHWQVILGPLLVLAVLFFRRGLAGIFQKNDAS